MEEFTITFKGPGPADVSDEQSTEWPPVPELVRDGGRYRCTTFTEPTPESAANGDTFRSATYEYQGVAKAAPSAAAARRAAVSAEPAGN